MMQCVSILSLALVGVVNAGRAHLIVEKSFANPPVVEGRDVNVTLTVTNIGESAATDVVLSDKVRTQFFVLTGGEPVTKFDSIARYVLRRAADYDVQAAPPNLWRAISFSRATFALTSHHLLVPCAIARLAFGCTAARRWSTRTQCRR